MSTEQTVTAQSDQSIAAIDQATNAALQAAKARKAAKATSAPSNEQASAPEAKKRVIKTPEQRLEEAASREKDRAARKAAREAARDARRASKPASAPAHMKKVAKAAERLPALDEAVASIFEDAKTNLTPAQLEALAAHIGHFCRASATVDASAVKLTVGQSVKIIKGAPRFNGQVGTVTKAGRIRCLIAVPGHAKEVYLFNADVEPYTASAIEEPAQEEAPAEQAA